MKKMFQFLLVLCSFILLLGFDEKTAKAAKDETVFSDNDNGIVTIKYNNNSHAKIKIGVTKDKKSYYYDMNDGANEIDVPLNMGNGKYSIKILKNINGSKYGVLESTTIELELTDENLVFLQSNVVIDFELTDASIKKANEIVKNCKSEADKISAIYKYVVENFTYDYDKAANVKAGTMTGYLPDIEVVYKNKKGICYDLSAVMAAMLRSQGVKVKLVTGYTPNIKDAYHAWNSVYDSSDKEWYPVDTTYDVSMYQNNKKYKMKKADKDYSNIKYEY